MCTGDVVIVHTENGFWRLAKIKEVITSTDGQVRGAIVHSQLKDGCTLVLRRPIQRLYPLEINEDNETDSALEDKEPEPEPRGRDQKRTPKSSC